MISNLREQRGLVIAATSRITHNKNGTWIVPSQSGNGRYTVHLGPETPKCTCPDHETRGCKCKHIFAVEYAIQRERNGDGSVTVTEAVRVTAAKRTTYPQNWSAYNEAQTNEKRLFQSLLHDLCLGLPEIKGSGNGRPRLPMSDAVFAAAFKVYSTVSARRFACDLEEARAGGHIGCVPHFNTVLNYLDEPAMFGVLSDLIIRSSAPLGAVESDFAVDSTGFGTSRHVRWFDHKYGTAGERQAWVKCHFICGVRTNVVTAAEIYDPYTNDCRVLPSLVKTTARHFNLAEVSADKAYSSHVNLATIVAQGAEPYIPFKSSTTGRDGGLFGKMYHLFCLNQEEFLAHYHKRSNVESTVSMIKAKFGDHVRSRTETAMKNEVLCKVLCHNLCCLVSAIYELGINPKFEALAA